MSVPDLDRPAIALSVTLLIVAIVLQRIGLTLGTSYLSVVGPIGLVLGAYGFWRGTLEFERARFVLFIGFVGWIAIGGAVRAAVPDYYGTAPSWNSLIQFVALTAFGLLTFHRPVQEQRFFHAINQVLAGLAIAGIVQFLLQFVGLGLFSFKGLVPDNLLIEDAYVTVISIGTSGYFKANGFFLVEPSVFSQFMALAIIIEMLTVRRTVYLLLFAGGLIASISGTGWLMIFSFVLTAAFSLGVRGVLLSGATLLMGALGLAALALLFPAGFQLFMDRTG